jgi:hypothetical protein
MRTLTQQEAEQFVMMVLSGAPVSEVVRYFWDEPLSDEELLVCMRRRGRVSRRSWW